ncbi:MAG TPA: sensor histidine kinase KdpD [Gemmataceae bacterium]|nr:sensor histidine kinase KdpD [Gemmataceae bacterium]
MPHSDINDNRPDPDALLAHARAEDPSPKRGKLKIFFGYAPGVGKTYAMLEAARKEGKAGADVVVGYIEPHVRPDTLALVLGLDMLAKKTVEYRGATLQEFDLEAALERRPQLLIVDELAHTNAPGLTHAKRWQDVEQLLQAGIDVYSTLNVQHLESLNDIIARVTGITVRETVPDSVFDAAHEVELVDISPDDLIERLQEGKVYLPDQAARAVENFFRKGNLYALRELALRRTAERVNLQVEDYRRAQAAAQTWPTAERLLVCVGPSPLSARLVRAARRMATSLKCPWVAVYVETSAAAAPRTSDREQVLQNLRLAEQLGAETVTLSGSNPVDEILHYARDHNVTKIIVGKPQQPRWRELIRGSFVYKLTRKCGDIDVYVISGEGEENRPASSAARGRPPALLPYLWSAGIVAFCTLVGFLLYEQSGQPSDAYRPLVNIIMVYLLGVVAVSIWFGRWPSILASFLSVAAFDFCFVPPRGTFTVEDAQYLFTFAVMLITGLVISTLTSRLKLQSEGSRRREQRTASLYALSRDLAAMQSQEEILHAVVRHTGSAFDAQVAILLPDAAGKLIDASTSVGTYRPTDRDLGVAKWVYNHGQKAGSGTGTLPGADALYLPLAASGRLIGVIGVKSGQPDRFDDPEQVHLLEALASQTAAALERVHLARDAERIKVEIETERLRNALLSSVSHDLRTPLAAIAGATSTLLDGATTFDAHTKQELLQTILEESESLNRLVGNLLDTTRLEAGALKLHSEWQSLEELLGVVLNRLSRQLEQHPLTTHVPPDLPLVRGDGVLLQQVLLNLLENAAKYSPPGAPIEVTASTRGRELLVEIADRGRGLTPGDEERIFDKFHRAADTAGRAGAGLGLTVCKGVVHLHGGRIWAENRPGGGAVFRFTLPIDVPPPEVSVESPALTAAGSAPSR